MIKANELRVDNWLMGHLTKEPVRVDWMVIKHLWDGNIQSAYTPDIPVYEPIPLTPEIMEAAGFKKGYGTIGYTMDIERGFLYTFLDGELSINDHLEEYGFDFPCQYLHQLQNLFFALTGTELEINIHADKQTT